MVGVGALLGSLVSVWLGPRLPRRAAYSIGFLVSGAPRYAVLLLAATLPPIVAVFLLAGVAAGSLNPILAAAMYERVPEHLRARVLGAVKASAWIGMPFGSLLAGAAAEAAGVPITLALTGLVYAAITLAPFVFPAWRGLDRGSAPAGLSAAAPAAPGPPARPGPDLASHR